MEYAFLWSFFLIWQPQPKDESGISLFLLEFCVFSPVSIYIYTVVFYFCVAVQPVKSVLPVGSATTTCIPVGSACTNEYVEAAAPVIL
jgi:hypothetical protein